MRKIEPSIQILLRLYACTYDLSFLIGWTIKDLNVMGVKLQMNLYSANFSNLQNRNFGLIWIGLDSQKSVWSNLIQSDHLSLQIWSESDPNWNTQNPTKSDPKGHLDQIGEAKAALQACERAQPGFAVEWASTPMFKDRDEDVHFLAGLRKAGLVASLPL